MSAARIVSLPVGFLSCLALLPTQFVLKLSVVAMLPSSVAKSPVSIPVLCSAPCKHEFRGTGQEAAPHLQTHRRSSFLLQTPALFALLPGLLLSTEAARALVPDVSPPLLSRGVAVGSQGGEQQQRGGWCPGGALGTGGLGARGVWPGCAAAARPPGAGAVQGVGKQMMPRWGAWGLWKATGPGKKINCTWDITLCVGLVLGDVQMAKKEGGLS